MDEKERFEERPRRKRKHRWAFPLGLGIVALAVVGLITLISWGVGGIKDLTDKTALKAEYEGFLTQVVRNDPDPFDDISKANMSQLLDAAIWKVISNPENEPGQFEFSTEEPVGYIIKQSDVEMQFEKTFGPEVKPQHMTVAGNGYDFTYIASKSCYIIPITGIDYVYTPKVDSISKKGDSIILIVGYISNGDWKQDARGRFVDPDPVKFMKITLRETNGDPPYYIAAIQETDPKEYADRTKPPEKDETTTEPGTIITAESTAATAETSAGETIVSADTSAESAAQP